MLSSAIVLKHSCDVFNAHHIIDDIIIYMIRRTYYNLCNEYFLISDRRGENQPFASGDANVRSGHVFHTEVANWFHGLYHKRHV